MDCATTTDDDDDFHPERISLTEQQTQPTNPPTDIVLVKPGFMARFESYANLFARMETDKKYNYDECTFLATQFLVELPAGLTAALRRII